MRAPAAAAAETDACAAEVAGEPRPAECASPPPPRASVSREVAYLDRSVLSQFEGEVLAAGRHQFAFSVDLPSDTLPPSCGESTESVAFQVAYHVEARVAHAAGPPQLVRSVYLNVEAPPCADDDAVSGTVVEGTTSTVRSYDGANLAAAIVRGRGVRRVYLGTPPTRARVVKRESHAPARVRSRIDLLPNAPTPVCTHS